MGLIRTLALPILAMLAWGASSQVWAAPLSESDRQIYTAAFDAMKRGDWNAAETLAAPARDRLPAQALSFLDYSRKGSGASFGDISTFLASHPNWPNQKLLQTRAEEAIATATDAQLVPWFQAHPPILPAAQLRLAQIWMQSGRRADAERLIRQAWIQGDYSAIEEKFMLERYRDVLRGEDNAR